MLRKALLYVFVAGAALSSLTRTAEAGKYYYGTSEKLHVITKTGLINEGKPISLCYKTSTFFLLAGVYTTDQYVLCEDSSSTRYWPLPAGEQLAGLQQQGLLPSPLPPYKRELFDYVIGYSLWLLLAVIALVTYFGAGRSKAEAQKKLDLLKLTARRIMARIISSSAGSPDRGVNVARQVYQALFKEPLQDADFSADMHWVRSEPIAFDGFIGAIGRNLDNKAKVVLLRAAAYVGMADGGMDAGEEEAIRQLGDRLGMKRKEADGFLDSLRRQSVGSSAPTA
jgi:hypothetical protein